MGLLLHPTFALANRAEIEDEIERLIGILDRVDGDPDLEDDDPAGDTLDEHGEPQDWRGHEILDADPIYGIDQSKGPINEREAVMQRDRALSLLR